MHCWELTRKSSDRVSYSHGCNFHLFIILQFSEKNWHLVHPLLVCSYYLTYNHLHDEASVWIESIRSECRMPPLLSKTKYLNGRQCPRYLWVLFNDPDKVPAPDPNTQYVFDQGHMVGELAKQLFPDGVSRWN